ncbi:MBL fold metallo-hydrolase [Paenibacillus mesophilus]|uniref:MBL fold metallo-hydrolase n=1 Tax=Paenibacillus mesophilus TaxID=2582849 RepID=UPI001EE4E075|nr:MBL fold metallo-hydrolase [Paenibacillus mesophilus]
MTRYNNMDGAPKSPTFRDLQAWRKERKAKVKDLSFEIPRAPLDPKQLAVSPEACRFAWIGHSTFLLQMGGMNVLTDPVWANRMGFERRLSPPGIAIDHMPDVDVVLLSHSHYDHLHIPSLRKLKGSPLHLVPAGVAALLKRKGVTNVQEFSWWESRKIGMLTFTFVPAEHWTRRSLWDMNRSHWGGWMIESDGPVGIGHSKKTVYFAGDSGYFRGFAEIGSKFRDIDIALMPIGAYEPEWFMSPQHVSPEEAVQAFKDVGAKTFVPMHYGAFRLADDTPKEALDRLHEAWQASGLQEGRLLIPKLGELVGIN